MLISQFGLVAPWWFCESYENVIGKRQCELHIQLGTLHQAKDAHTIGLIDEIHTSFDTMKESAINQVKKWNKVNQFAKRQSKWMLRKELYQKLDSTRKEDVEEAVNVIGSANIQKILGIYLQSLQKKTPDRNSKL